MRGAFYVTIALLVAASRRTAAYFLYQTELLQTSGRDGIEPGGTVAKRVAYRNNHQQHDDLTLSADDDERAPPPTTLDLIGKLEIPLFRTSMGSVEAKSAMLKAPQESALTGHHPAHPESIASNDAAFYMMRGDGLPEKATMERPGTSLRQRQQPAQPGMDDFVRKSQLLTHTGASENDGNSQGLVHPNFSTSSNAHPHTRPTNEQIDLSLNDWRRGMVNMQNAPHLPEQHPNSPKEFVGPKLAQNSVVYQSDEITAIAGFNEGPFRIQLPNNYDELQKIAEVHNEFIMSSGLPCKQTLRETHMMLVIYNWEWDNSPNNDMIAALYGRMTSQMTTQDLVRALSQDVRTMHESNPWTLVANYRKMLYDACNYELKLLSTKGHKAVLEDGGYWNLLRYAYQQKSTVMYHRFYSFCVHHSALCTTI